MGQTVTAILPRPSDQIDMKRWNRVLLKIDIQPAPEGKGLETPCWIWTGAVTGKTLRPKMKWRGSCVLVARWMLAMCVRPFQPGELACHKCDVPLCVNPGHLEHGTHSKNLVDAWARRRRTRPCTFFLDLGG